MAYTDLLFFSFEFLVKKIEDFRSGCCCLSPKSVWYLVSIVYHFDFMLFTANSKWQTVFDEANTRTWSLSTATNRNFFFCASTKKALFTKFFFLTSSQEQMICMGKTLVYLSLMKCILFEWSCTQKETKSIEMSYNGSGKWRHILQRIVFFFCCCSELWRKKLKTKVLAM